MSIPPGLTKQKEATESVAVKEKVDSDDKEEGLQPKSGEEVIDSALDVVKGDPTSKTPDIKATTLIPPIIKSKADIEPTIKKTVDGPNTNKTKVVAEAPNSKPKVADDPSGRADTTVPSNNPPEKDLKPSNNATLKPYAKTNIKSGTIATPVEDVKISNKSSMTASDLDLESSGSFTSAFEFDYSSK